MCRTIINLKKMKKDRILVRIQIKTQNNKLSTNKKIQTNCFISLFLEII